MCVRMLFRHAAACLLIGVGLTTATRAQYIYPYIGAPRAGSYPNTYLYHYGFHGYYPNIPYNVPRPPTGTYLPGRPWPLPPYVLPPGGLVPQPYPYYYQPPLDAPQWYVWPYYPAIPAPPYSYYYQRPFIRPRSTWRPSRRYGAATSSDGAYSMPRK